MASLQTRVFSFQVFALKLHQTKNIGHLSPCRLIDETDVVKEGHDGGQGGEDEEGRQVIGEEEDT